jgi:hypothetical protein
LIEALLEKVNFELECKVFSFNLVDELANN